MELIILGEHKDHTKEIEIFATEDNDCFKYGFNVILTCKEYFYDKQEFTEEKTPVKMYDEGQVIVCHNVTEYHHLWESKANGDWKDRLACESDIHSTGWVPWDIFDKFSKIEVVKAEKLHTSYSEE